MFWVPIAVGAAEGTAYVSYRYGPQISNAVTTYGPKIVNGASRCYNTAVIYGSQAMNMLANQVDKIPSIFNMGSDAASKAVEKSGSSNSGGTGNFDPNDPRWKDLVGKTGEHFGSKGVKIDSKTIWQNGKTERIDIENSNPGKFDASIHYHESNNTKWLLDVKNKYFYQSGKNGEIIRAPNKIQKLLENEKFQKNINKGLKFLGEKSIF